MLPRNHILPTSLPFEYSRRVRVPLTDPEAPMPFSRIFFVTIMLLPSFSLCLIYSATFSVIRCQTSVGAHRGLHRSYKRSIATSRFFSALSYFFLYFAPGWSSRTRRIDRKLRLTCRLELLIFGGNVVRHPIIFGVPYELGSSPVTSFFFRTFAVSSTFHAAIKELHRLAMKEIPDAMLTNIDVKTLEGRIHP